MCFQYLKTFHHFFNSPRIKHKKTPLPSRLLAPQALSLLHLRKGASPSDAAPPPTGGSLGGGDFCRNRPSTDELLFLSLFIERVNCSQEVLRVSGVEEDPVSEAPPARPRRPSPRGLRGARSWRGEPRPPQRSPRPEGPKAPFSAQRKGFCESRV